MDSESVVFGKWDNHGNKGNLRLSAQNSQKVDEDIQLVFKHGNKHIMDVDDISSLKKVIEYTVIREVEGFELEKAYDAVKLYNKYHRIDMNPEEAIEGWNFKDKIEK